VVLIDHPFFMPTRKNRQSHTSHLKSHTEPLRVMKYLTITNTLRRSVCPFKMPYSRYSSIDPHPKL